MMNTLLTLCKLAIPAAPLIWDMEDHGDDSELDIISPELRQIIITEKKSNRLIRNLSM